MKIIKIMTCGSVDDGKSTLLGRLIYETNNLLEDQSFYLSELNKRYSKKDIEIDYSLLLDGLIDEKEQGITIDLAFKYFTLPKTQFTLIDSPGHVEFTKNMANAATFADAALILIDASKGLTSQTKRHFKIINLFPNVKKKIICINKMDKVNYKKSVYIKVVEDTITFLNEINFRNYDILPISALKGDNIVNNSKNLNFYKGKNLYEHLISMNIKYSKKDNGHAIVKFIKLNNKNRIYFIENVDISYRIGDKLKNVYTKEVSEIKKIYHNDSSINYQKNLRNTSVVLKDEISISKGDTLVLENQNTTISDTFKIKLIWVGSEKLIKGKRYIFKFHSKSEKGFISKIEDKDITRNSIVTVQVELESKLNISEIRTNYNLSQLVVIDPVNLLTVGFGYVSQLLDRGSTVIYEKIQEAPQLNQKCIWLTGLPASGKTTIAKSLANRIKSKGLSCYIIDGDNIRSTLNKDLGFSTEDRIENNRRVAHIAKILFDAGITPIVATVSPTNVSRDFARSLFRKGDFILVHVNTSLEECIRRDPKKLYNNPAKKIKNVTGLHSSYEEPFNPEIMLDTETLSLRQSVNKILRYLKW